MRSAVAVLTFALFACVAFAVDLMPCPDCGQPVSPRAMMCPHCGCPGDAIKEAATLRQQERESVPQFPVVRATTERSGGYAVAYGEGGRHFLVMDADQLADATSLELLPLATNAPVAYQRMQIARDAGLVRFETTATNLVFLARASSQYASRAGSAWLMPDGKVIVGMAGATPPDGTLASVDAQTNLVGVVCRDVRTAVLAPLPHDPAWLDVAPNAFRQQMALLAKAEKETTEGRISGETVRMLEETRWLSTFLEERARRISEGSKEERKP